MTQPTSFWLAKYVNYKQVLTALGYTSISHSLPARTECRICRGQLIIYPDINGGEWIYCSDCKIACDLFEYAAAVWDLDVPTAITKLKQRGVHLHPDCTRPYSMESYTRDILGHRKRLSNFTQIIATYPFWEKEELCNLHDKFHLQYSSDPVRWSKQMKHNIGWCHIDDVLKMVRPGSIAPINRGKRPRAKSGGPERIFVGRNWKELLVIPFYDVPGRLSSFWFIGRDGNYPKDFVFRLARVYAERCGLYREAGLGFYNTVSNSSEFEDTSFILQDPVLALLIHSRWFKDYSYQLPLGLAHRSIRGWTEYVFRCLPRRDWVFWDTSPNVAVFSQACKVDGRVLFSPMEDISLSKYKPWLYSVKKKAKPWDEVLKSIVPTLEDKELESILLAMELPANDWNQFFSKLKRTDKRRVIDLSNRAYFTKKVSFSGKHGGIIEILETPTGWYVTRAKLQAQISSATIRLNEYYKNELDELMVRATISTSDIDIQIDMKEETFRQETADIVLQQLIEANAPPPILNPFWKKYLYDIAMHFHTPKAIDQNNHPSSQPAHIATDPCLLVQPTP